jgi:radical SAM protein with 4Fe4S-binding SPASM domain
MFPMTGPAVDEIPGRMDLVRRFRTSRLDESKLATLLAALELFPPRPGSRVLINATYDDRLDDLLGIFLESIDSESPVECMWVGNAWRHPRRWGERMFAQLDNRAPVGALIVEAGNNAELMQQTLAEFGEGIDPGGLLFVIGMPDAPSEATRVADAFLAAHPEFEVISRSSCLVAHRRQPATSMALDRVNLCLNFKACNLRCPACWNTHSPEKPDATGKLAAVPWPELDRLLASPATQDTTIVVVGGGEPFMYPEIDRFLKAAPTSNRRLMVMTNATLLHKTDFWDVAEYAPITLSISLDAARAETYAFVRQPAKWESTIRNIERFIELRDTRNPLLRLQTSFVVLRQNVGEIVEFMHLNKKWGSEYVHFHPAMSAGFPEAWRLAADDPELVTQILEAASFGELHGIGLDPIDHIIPSATHDPMTGQASDPRSSCEEYRQQVAVDVAGETYICDTAFRIGFSLGNAFRESLDTLWNGSRWQSLREAHVRGTQRHHPLCKHCLMGQ